MGINYIKHDMVIDKAADFGGNILWVTGNLTIKANVTANLIVANKNICISNSSVIVTRHIQSFGNISISHAVDLGNVDSIFAEGEITIDHPIRYPKKVYACEFIKLAPHYQCLGEEHLEPEIDGEYEALDEALDL